MAHQPLSADEQREATRFFAMELFHFEGGGIPRAGTSYQLRSWDEPQPPEPPRREPSTSGEREAMVLRPQREFAEALQAWRELPYHVQVFTALGTLRFDLRGRIAKEFLLWIGGMVACPSCEMVLLTMQTNNETCPKCRGRLLRCYDALVWARTHTDFAAGDWVDVVSVPPGTYVLTEHDQRGIVLVGDGEGFRPIAWAGSGELGQIALEVRVRALRMHGPSHDTESTLELGQGDQDAGAAT